MWTEFQLSGESFRGVLRLKQFNLNIYSSLKAINCLNLSLLERLGARKLVKVKSESYYFPYKSLFFDKIVIFSCKNKTDTNCEDKIKWTWLTHAVHPLTLL